ncbi:PEP-CTERM sorting domain-containing protein [Paracoccus acridae]|nr:PEP-CTERM sorting domain-containing protein [Paracoccus acridae]
MKSSLLSGAAGAILLAMASQTQAATIVLDFEGIYETYPSNSSATVGGFYNGGTSSVGTSGTNYGVEFSGNALAVCLNTLETSCSNGSRGGLGNPASQQTALFFVEGTETFMNVAAGFTTGFSFFYSSVNVAGSISVYDGLNGTGALLATLALGVTASNCSSEYNAPFCPFAASGIGFEGLAKSVSFAGAGNQIAFDDVTFGSVTPDPDPDPSPVPVPAAFPMLAGGLGLLSMLRRRKVK